MSVLVQFVVRQFDLLEWNHLLHELLSGERGVRVDVQPAGPDGTGQHPLFWLAEALFLIFGGER